MLSKSEAHSSIPSPLFSPGFGSGPTASPPVLPQGAISKIGGHYGLGSVFLSETGDHCRLGNSWKQTLSSMLCLFRSIYRLQCFHEDEFSACGYKPPLYTCHSLASVWKLFFLQLLMRPCALIKPDTRQILSVYLQTYAFQHHVLWAQKLNLFLNQLESQVHFSTHSTRTFFLEKKKKKKIARYVETVSIWSKEVLNSSAKYCAFRVCEAAHWSCEGLHVL